MKDLAGKTAFDSSGKLQPHARSEHYLTHYCGWGAVRGAWCALRSVAFPFRAISCESMALLCGRICLDGGLWSGAGWVNGTVKTVNGLAKWG